MNTSRILAAVGIGSESEHATVQADELARASGAELHVIHAIPNALGGYPFFYQGSFSYDRAEKFQAEAAETRRTLLRELTAYVARLTGREPTEFVVEVHQGCTDEVVLAAAAKCQASQIVVAFPREEHATDPDVRGILRHAEVPVRIARLKSRSNQIVVGTDFSDPALPAVGAAAREAKRTSGAVTVIHSIELTTAVPVWSAMGPIAFDIPADVRSDLRGDIERQLQEALDRHGIAGRTRVAEGSPIRALLDAAKELDADLIVVGTQGRTGISRALIGSVAEEVAVQAHCSVLVVRLAHS